MAQLLPPGEFAEWLEAFLPHVVSDDYMVTHWLAAYAVLLFS